MRSTFIIAAASVAALLTATPVLAQANRTFVSGHGVDSNPCSLAAPCRSFAQALTQTNTGGEITVLDSAGYGTVTIAKSVTITNPGGVEAGITTTAGQTAITINTSPSIVVTLRGLTLEGGGVGQNGIRASGTPGTLNIIDCVVKDFVQDGIRMGANASANVLIATSFVLNNGGSGIHIFDGSTYAIDHTTVAGNGTSGDDAGILIAASTGVISSSQAYTNNIGANFVNGGGAIRDSVLINNNIDLNQGSGSPVILNSNLILHGAAQSVTTDKTNNCGGTCFGPFVNLR